MLFQSPPPDFISPLTHVAILTLTPMRWAPPVATAGERPTPVARSVMVKSPGTVLKAGSLPVGGRGVALLALLEVLVLRSLVTGSTRLRTA